MSLEITFPIPKGYSFIQAYGQGRVVGFLIQSPLGPQQVAVIHLDHPGVSVESKVPRVYDTSVSILPSLMPSESLNTTWYQNNPWGICIPAESLLIVYTIEHILAYKIPSFSSLSPGVNRSDAAPMWRLPGPDTGLLVSYMTSESFHNSASAQEFNVSLYYVGGTNFAQIEPFVTTVTIPINTKSSFISKSTEPPAVKQKSTAVRNHVGATVCLSSRKGLHFDVATGRGHPSLHILVTPLNDPGSESGRKILRMSLSLEDLISMKIKVDMDETTGRVVIWGWDSVEYGTKVFVGDLV